MSRASWINDESHPDLDAHVSQLEHFSNAIADGVVDDAELAKQEQLLLAAMRGVEASLSDEQHAKTTKLLAELVAFTAMKMLHEMAAAKAQHAMSRGKQA
jgi:aldehyde:ferredoxin oxidoreductase